MRLRNLLEYGLSASADIETRRHVVFSNLVYVVVGSILLINVTLFFFVPSGNFPQARLIPVILVVVSALCYLLNVRGWYLASRIFFVLSWISLVNVVPIMMIGPTRATYFTGASYIIVFSPAIQLFFSYNRERAYLIFFMVVTFLLTLFYIDFLMAFDRSPNPEVPFVSVTTLRINFVTLWIFLNVTMVYILRINRRFYSEIQHQKEIIETQQLKLRLNNEELAITNRDLTSANQELTNLNDQVRSLNHELEDRVTTRTKELVEQNDKLKEYAFMNAHLLRSPVSRIKGLINLFEMTKEPQEKEKIQALLSQTADELDSVIHTISDRLNKT